MFFLFQELGSQKLYRQNKNTQSLYLIAKANYKLAEHVNIFFFCGNV